uniref:Uncharacterized protein n=1 Tax=Nonomuraea gerenzanensis TaxID=93944 RepID=A0A1M4E2X7_9ACTN|nr:hypothetical protein BN4615_P2673 [Nonomuraea gerenzanensis]
MQRPGGAVARQHDVVHQVSLLLGSRRPREEPSSLPGRLQDGPHSGIQRPSIGRHHMRKRVMPQRVPGSCVDSVTSSSVWRVRLPRRP